MRKRLYVDPAAFAEGGARALLRGDDHHHVARVLRLGLGAELELADGSGWLHRGRISRLEGGCVEVAIGR